MTHRWKSGLMPLAALALLTLAAPSRAVVCTWITLQAFAGGNIQVQSACIASGPGAVWDTVEYITVGPQNDYIKLPVGAGLPPNQLVPGPQYGHDTPPGRYDVVGIAHGHNAGGRWDASTGDTYITVDP